MPAGFKLTQGFTPKSITGCQLWLDAADTNTTIRSGSNVTTWNDKSGNNYHMNTLTPNASWSGTAQYPTIGTSINGLQTLNFSSQAGLKQGTTLDGVKNLFWVGRIAAPTGTAAGGAAIYFLLGHDNNYDWHASYYGQRFIDGTNAQGGIYGATASLFTSDTNAVTNATFGLMNLPSAPNISLLSVTGITGTTRYQGICYDRTTHTGWCGDLAEVITFSTALTTAQREQVEGYLAQKWGLVNQMPESHISKRAVIYPSVRKPNTLIPYYTQFSPRSIPGCILWLDGADTSTMTLNSGNVSQWNDKSGKGYNATTPAGTNSPFYNAATRELQFLEANTNVLRIAQGFGDDLVGTTYSIFFIGRRTTASGFHFFLGSTGNGASRILLMIGFFENNMQTNVYGPAFDSSIPAYRSPDPVRIYCYELQSSSLVTHIMNGTQIGSDTQNYTLTSFANPELGRRYGSVPHSFNLSEMIAFSPALTAPQRQQVESYLAQKWNLSSSLPSDHINRRFPVGVPSGLANIIPEIPRGVKSKLPIPVQQTQTFTYTGSNQTFVVPATTNNITVYMWGGGGGGGYSGTGTLYGGAGAYVQGVLSVTPSSTLNIIVGGGGAMVSYPNTSYTYGGGGTGGGDCGSGGGRSAIRVSSATEDIVTVGAGGGSAYWSYNNSYGGNGDSVTGTGGNGGTSGSYYGGLGGTQIAGGAVGYGDYGYGISGGSKYTGGNARAETGGGGGGGYYGGGGGGYYNYGSGGGGGSSFTSNLTSLVVYNSPNRYSAPNTASSYYQAGVAAGGSNAQSGGPGLVVLVYMA